jgi:hypothetical protein
MQKVIKIIHFIDNYNNGLLSKEKLTHENVEISKIVITIFCNSFRIF